MRTLETVDRALQMLQLFDRPGQEKTVSALAAGVGIHRSSASRFAATLAERGFLERSAGGEGFCLGPEIGRLGMLAIADRDLTKDAQPIMRRLAEQTGETVVLSVLDGDEALDIAQADGTYLIGTRKWIGRRSPLYASSAGKVFLAFTDIDILELSLEPRSGRAIASQDQLQVEIEQVRDSGWAAARGELEEGLYGVAAQVRGDRGQCIAALSVSGPEYRVPDTRLSELAVLVVAAADEISARLGGVVSSDP
ncbi:IclR family transcriptional regulator [Arthrobacter sp. ZGTC131]|uniref:IclR family transcriptional regulator n=1 Tax=Arthrobacter sp. ZGTC131 TaxID=2058898 RepID=UPI000CE48F45|nr:IclR family transcriptional regulator [Arthrobacter sp. ZGTC131]